MYEQNAVHYIYCEICFPLNLLIIIKDNILRICEILLYWFRFSSQYIRTLSRIQVIIWLIRVGNNFIAIFIAITFLTDTKRYWRLDILISSNFYLKKALLFSFWNSQMLTQIEIENQNLWKAQHSYNVTNTQIFRNSKPQVHFKFYE